MHIRSCLILFFYILLQISCNNTGYSEEKNNHIDKSIGSSGNVTIVSNSNIKNPVNKSGKTINSNINEVDSKKFNIRTIHVFVALCDNKNQGIVPVPEKIGNGQDPKNNLYWGAGYGVKNFFDKKTGSWELIKVIKNPRSKILERCVFKHNVTKTYLLADAYDGAEIRQATIDFLKASAGDFDETVEIDTLKIGFGGHSDLIAYTGHDGLMDFSLSEYPIQKNILTRNVIILACYSKEYFTEAIKISGAHPLLWTTHLMAPEAYTLKAAIDGWIKNESGEEIRTRAANAYNDYQKCGLKGARNLLVTGW